MGKLQEITRKPHVKEDAIGGGGRGWAKNCQLTVSHFSTNGISLRRSGRRSSYKNPLLIVANCPCSSPLAASCSRLRIFSLFASPARRGELLAGQCLTNEIAKLFRAEQVDIFDEIGIACGTCADRTARQKYESALYIFICLDFWLVVLVTSSIVHDVEWH